MCNTEYRRVKRILDKHNGDATKIKDELGFDVPTRAKRQRKTNPAKESSTPEEISSSAHRGVSTSNDSDLPEVPVSGNSGRSESEAPVSGNSDRSDSEAPASSTPNRPEAPVSGSSVGTGLFSSMIHLISKK